MRLTSRLLLCAAVSLGLLATASPALADEDNNEGSVTGTVTAAGGTTPIAGITVTIGAQTTTTAADGTYTIDDIDLDQPEDTATVDVEFADEDATRNGNQTAYQSTTREDVVITEVDEGEDAAHGVATVNASLVRKAYIKGTVTDFDGGDDPSGCVEVLPVYAGDHGFSSPNVLGDPVEIDGEDGTYVIEDVELEVLSLVFRDCDGAEGDERRYRSEIWNNEPVGENAVEGDWQVHPRTEYTTRDLTEANPILLTAGEVRTVDAQLAHNAGPSGSHCGVTPFPDVAANNQFCDDIYWMDELNIAGGYADGQFKSANPVSRQAMSAFLYRFAHDGVEPAETDCEEAPFDDVPANSPFCAHIEWMVEEGITTGFVGTDDFQPASPVSRQAMAAFLYRFEQEGDPSPTSCTTEPFNDVAENHPFCAHIEWLDETNISDGYNNGTEFRPAISISRQAMAAFLHRLWNLKPEPA